MAQTPDQLPSSEALLNALGQGVIVLGPERRILFLSEWVARTARLDPAQTLGRDVFEVFPEVRGSRLATAIRAALERGNATFLSHSLNRTALPLYRPADSRDPEALIPQSTTVSGVPGPDGRWCCLVAITDVSRMLAREAALRRAKEQADAANMAKTRFVANVSHELRTPLNAVLGFSEMMAQQVHGPLGSAKYGEYVRHIADSGQILLSLIDDILDLSKIESGRFELEERLLALDEIARASVDSLTPQAGRNGQRLTLEAPTPVRLYADERAVRQILMNLLSNALKFTPSGGHVTVCVDLDDSGGPRIVVADDGPGIPQKDIELVLSPYGQSRDVMTTRNVEGTGLGLPICKALTTLHGGSFRIESEVGQGTTVQVTFPPRRRRD